MPNIGPLEIVVILIVALIVFGPKRLPEMGRSLGKGMREFKDSVTGKDDHPAALPTATETTTTVSPTPTRENETAV